MGTAIKVGDGVKGVRIINCDLRGEVGLDVGKGAEVQMSGGRVKARVGVVAGPDAKVELQGVTLETTLLDVLQHFTADIFYLRTVARKLEIYADDPRYEVPRAVKDDLRRAAEATSVKKAASALRRAVNILRDVDLVSRTPQLLGRLQDLLEILLQHHR